MMRPFVLFFSTLCICLQPFAQSLPSKKLADTLYLVSGTESAKQTAFQKELYNKQIQAVQDSGLVFSCLKQKQKAPDFTLKNIQGKSINLLAEIQKGPMVILWHQGGWNTYSIAMLKYYQSYAAEYKKYGASIIAITPEVNEKIAITKSKNKISFEVLHDEDNRVAQSFGIKYRLMDTLNIELEKRFAISTYNGNKQGEFPLSAAYIIHPNGKVVYAFVEADDRLRAEPSDVLRVLKGMGFPEQK
jgi:peroxiredoxin